MANERITRRISDSLRDCMVTRGLKLDYVALSADVGVETVRRVKSGEVTRLWDTTARRLAEFLERETDGDISATDLLGLSPDASLPIAPDAYRTLLDTMMDGMYLIQGDRIIYSNRRVEEMTGYSLDELRAAKYTRFLDPETRADERARRSSSTRDEADRYTVALLRKDGTRVHAETHIARFSLNGTRTALGTLRPIDPEA